MSLGKISPLNAYFIQDLNYYLEHQNLILKTNRSALVTVPSIKIA